MSFRLPKGFSWGLQFPYLRFFACIFFLCARSGAETNSLTKDLRLTDLIRLVLERNESVQERILDFEINRRQYKAEQGIFEPELVLGYSRVENDQQNTAQQRRSTGVAIFTERNNIYDSGLEALVPTGARIRLGYTLRDLRNNLQDPPVGTIVTNGPRREYQTFVGLSVTQPLLKNAWTSATFANIHLAALGSDIAFQEYRRQLMTILTTAEATYWNLYLSQEQARFFQDSVALAEGLVRETRARVEAGKGAELDVMQLEAGLALRRSKLAEAQHKHREAVAQLRALTSLPSSVNAFELRATDQPNPSSPVPLFQDACLVALRLNPDYLSQLKKVAQEDIKVAYAKNQRLPQLDLKASYGLNGLSSSPGGSWQQAASSDFPSFTVGAELRVPLEGGIRSKNQVQAALLRKRQVLLQLKEVETQVINAIELALFKIRNARDGVENYRAVVDYNENLLKTQLARLDVGKVEGRKVLEVEADLFEAKNAVMEAQVQSERALLELALIEGAFLESRDLDLNQKELQKKTAEVFQRVGGSDERFRQLLGELKARYSLRNE